MNHHRGEEPAINLKGRRRGEHKYYHSSTETPPGESKKKKKTQAKAKVRGSYNSMGL